MDLINSTLSLNMNRRIFQKLLLKSAAVSLLPMPLNASPLKKSKPLKPGDTIGLIAPAGKIDQDRILKAIANLELLGLKVHYDKNILDRHGYLAGTDQRRLDEIHRMYSDSNIHGIWCIRGGYGTTRILDKLNFNLIKKNPKPLLGYSDITALLNTIYQNTGSPCFHAPVASSKFSPYTIKHLAPIFGLKKDLTIKNSNENISAGTSKSVFKSYTINKGIAQGKLAGGNLSLLVSLIGTKHQVDTKNKILFIEDIGEEPYRIDRMLTQMISAGQFKNVKGIALGVFAGCHRKDENSLTLEAVIRDRIGDLNIPAVYGFSFGHIDHQCTFPIGANAVLDAASNSVKLLEDNY